MRHVANDMFRTNSEYLMCSRLIIQGPHWTSNKTTGTSSSGKSPRADSTSVNLKGRVLIPSGKKPKHTSSFSFASFSRFRGQKGAILGDSHSRSLTGGVSDSSTTAKGAIILSSSNSGAGCGSNNSNVERSLSPDNYASSPHLHRDSHSPQSGGGGTEAMGESLIFSGETLRHT